MSPDNVSISPNLDWKRAVAESFRSLEDLLKFCEIDPLRIERNNSQDFPLRVT